MKSLNYMKRARGFAFFLLLANLASTGFSQTPVTKRYYAKFYFILGSKDEDMAISIAEFNKNAYTSKKIELDKGFKVFVDSTEMNLDTEFYPHYSTEQHRSTYPGKHHLSIQLPDGRQQKYPFEAKSFRITSAIPSEVGKDDIVVYCDNLSKTDKVFMLISGRLSDNSERDLKITPEDGRFIIPASFWQKVEAEECSFWFNISTETEIVPDEIMNGGVIESTRVTKHYKVRIRKI